MAEVVMERRPPGRQPQAPAEAAGPLDGDNALAGWSIVAALAVVGYLLLAAGGAHGAATWTRHLFVIVAAVGFVAYGVAIYGYFRRLERRVPEAVARRRRFEEGLSNLFAQLEAGDLVRTTALSRELPEGLGNNFRAATEALANLAQQIQESSIEVASSATSVQQIAAELASSSAEQAASVVEITAAMEELARTAAKIADNATGQAGLAARSEASGNAGAGAVDQAVIGVEEVQKRIAAIASRADALGSRSKEIYRVLDLINEIAQETHILSLNAAIEAAAAGPEGRRFAVVADEVRRLAQRSQESVESVRHLLDEFAGSIRATIVATEEGGKEASRVLERSREAASSITDLRRSSGETARVARQISMATQQQNSASDEVVMTLREVSQVVQRMTSGLKDLSTTADRLNSLGLTIQLLAQSFTLDSPRSLKHLVESWVEELRPLIGQPAFEERLAELVQQSSFVHKGYYVDAHGEMTALSFSAPVSSDVRQKVKRLVKADERDRPWFKAVARNWRTALTPPYESVEGGEHCFTVGTPMPGPDGTMGVLSIDIQVSAWTRI
jgi:methyl-accepting chemotaxis protein